MGTKRMKTRYLTMTTDNCAGYLRLVGAMKGGLLATLTALVGSQAIAGLNCEKPIGQAESLICKYQSNGSATDFLVLDASLNAKYQRAIEVVPSKRVLQNEQRAWIAERNKCQDGECFRDQYTKRIRELSEIPKRGGEFEGKWEQCTMWRGENACNSFTLLQKGKKICGEWSFWASGRVYEGQLMAEQRDSGRAEWLLTCDSMKPGCARPDGSQPDWQPVKGELRLCHGVLHFNEGKTNEPFAGCESLNPHYALLRKPVDMKSGDELRKQPWMHHCLGN